MMKNKSQSIIIITAILLAHAASATEFNINAIDKDLRSGIDLSRFKEETSVTPGRYFVTVAINDIPLANGWELTWKEVDNKAEVCIPAELADTFGLQDTVRKTLTLKQGCVDFTPQADIKFRFEQSTQTLHVTVPQAMMQFRPNDWMPPSTWDNGVAGVLLDYNLFASHYQPQEGSSTDNANAYGTAGANLGAWRLRSDYQYNQTHAEGGVNP